jgi:hypothetical protein
LQFNSANELIHETATLIDKTDPSRLTAGKFFNEKGCMCGLGLVAYKHNERVQKMVDGFRAMREAEILDEDQLDIISDKIDDEVYVAIGRLAPTLSTEQTTSIVTAFDRAFRNNGKDAAVAAILGLQSAA